MDVKDKINEIITQKCEGKKSDFAKRVGIGVTTLSSWLSRDSIDYEKVAEAFPDISAEWLIRGKGPMIKKTNEGAIVARPTSNSELNDMVIADLTKENYMLKKKLKQGNQEGSNENIMDILREIKDSIKKDQENLDIAAES